MTAPRRRARGTAERASALELHVAAEEVMELDRPGRHGESNDVRLGRIAFDGPAAAGVAPLLACVFGGRALGAAVPSFAHLPLILGSDKKRLCKRTGATSAEEYARWASPPMRPSTS